MRAFSHTRVCCINIDPVSHHCRAQLLHIARTLPSPQPRVQPHPLRFKAPDALQAHLIAHLLHSAGGVGEGDEGSGAGPEAGAGSNLGAPSGLAGSGLPVTKVCAGATCGAGAVCCDGSARVCLGLGLYHTKPKKMPWVCQHTPNVI